MKMGRFAFLSPLPLEGLGATYDDHLRLIGKRIVDLPIRVIEVLSLGVTAEALGANIGSKSANSLKREPVDPKFQVEGVAPTNHSSSQKTRQIFLPFLANVNSCSSSLYVVVRPSVVCRLSVTFVHPTQPIEIFGIVSAPLNTLVT